MWVPGSRWPGGGLTKVSDAGAPSGTMITVAGLFYNTPARRKFLKSINTEMGHIADTIASMALCRPSVQFQLSHNNRIVKSWSPATDPAIGWRCPWRRHKKGTVCG
jgi:DNA mismatch repair protein MutL